MKNFFLVLLLAFILFIQNTLFSQLKEELRTEVLSYITKEAMEFPEYEREPLPFQILSISSEELSEAFLKYKVISIAKAFPDFMDKDTIMYDQEGKEIKLPQLSRIFRIKILNEIDVNNLIEELSSITEVLYAEKNSEMELASIDDFWRQWYLLNEGQNGGTPGADINIIPAWEIYKGSHNMIIGLIDAGVDLNHYELYPRVIGDSWDDAEVYHGAFMSGLMIANATNGVGVRGINWNSKVFSKRIFDYGGYIGDAAAANIIIQTVNSNTPYIPIFNNSWGGSQYSTTLRIAFAHAYKNNRTSVAASGNSGGNTLLYPAAYREVIAVGGTTDEDYKSDFSNYGLHIDLVAPGGKNNVNALRKVYGLRNFNNFIYANGTSASAALVTGVASLLKGYNQNLDNDDIQKILQLSAQKVRPETYTYNGNGWNEYVGYGRLDAKQALDLLRSPYTLNHYSSIGGTDMGSTNLIYMWMYGASNLPTGAYRVKRHEVRKTVSFPGTLNSRIWGRGVATTGWDDGGIYSQNFGSGYCDLIPGTVTSNSATLKTYVYEVWKDVFGQLQWLGWYPCQPDQVNFAYTVLGESMVAPAFSHFSQSPNPMYSFHSEGQVIANISQGNGDLNYHWRTEGTMPPPGYTVSFNGKVATIRKNNTSNASVNKDNAVFKFFCRVSNSAGSTAEHVYYFHIEPYNPPACPTLTWGMENGEPLDENTILNQSPDNPEMDISDYYVLMNPFLQESSDIIFSITEPEFSVASLDQLELMQVAVEWDQFAAVTGDGEIISYRKPGDPNRVTMDNRDDVTELLAEADGQVLEAPGGTILNIDVNSLRGGSKESMSNPFIVMRHHIPANKESPVGMIYLFEREYKNFYSKNNDNIICVKLEKGIGNVEIVTAQDVNIDQIMLVDGEENYGINYLTMLEAKHNEYGDMMEELSRIDESYCRISNGHEVSLKFENPPSDRKHVYILKSTGRYVEGVLSDSEVKLSNEREDQVESLPNKLTGNHPNPFNPSTTIKYSLSKEANVRINVYDLSGRLLMQLVNESRSPGEHSVLFNGSTLSSGVYFYKMEVFEGGRSVPSYTETRRMMLIK